MRKPHTSTAARVLEHAESRELPLRAPENPPCPIALQPPRAADRIKAALRRWLEEELP
jgi:hypothetical protein